MAHVARSAGPERNTLRTLDLDPITFPMLPPLPLRFKGLSLALRASGPHLVSECSSSICHARSWRNAEFEIG